MKSSFKTRLGKVVLILGGAFVAMFVFRFIYGYTTGLSEVRQEYFSDFLSDGQSYRRNYASDKFVITKGDAVASTPAAAHTVDITQKYEKTATVKSRSSQYERDEKTLRDKIKVYNAIIQYEHNVGGKGERELQLLIGIPPEKFDTFYVEMQRIGRIASKEVTKEDKTNEFKNLNAKKASLESMRQSLLEIKKQSGRIDEYMNLQDRILQVEQELQSLGVALGDFDEENEFCTVRFSLLESRIITVSMLHRIKVVFEWTVQFYLLIVCIAAACAVLAFFLLLIVDRLLPSIMSKLNT